MIQNQITDSNLPEILLRTYFHVYLNWMCWDPTGAQKQREGKLQRLFANIRALPLLQAQNHVSGLSCPASIELGPLQR